MTTKGVSHVYSLLVELQLRLKSKLTVEATKTMQSQQSKVGFLNPQLKSVEELLLSHRSKIEKERLENLLITSQSKFGRTRL